jgi:hypothetical protein
MSRAPWQPRDASQGPDWWRASDGMWYPPESHPAYVVRRVPRPTSTALPAPGAETAQAPTNVRAPVLTEPHPPVADAPGGPRSAPSPFAALRVVSLASLVLSLVGVNLPWATTDTALRGLSASVTGVGLGSGQLLCGVLAVVLVCSWWHLVATSRRSGVVLFASWLGALALSVYEMVDTIAVPTRGLFTLNIGAGLYLCGFAALMGSVCSLTDLAQLWSKAGAAGTVARGALWAGGLLALVLVAAASFFGNGAARSPVGPIHVESPNPPPDNGAGGTGPAGSGPSGGTGSSGSTGATGSTGDTGGSGNSGPGFFGNSGPGFLGNSGDSGNSGTGNSGPGGFEF